MMVLGEALRFMEAGVPLAARFCRQQWRSGGADNNGGLAELTTMAVGADAHARAQDGEGGDKLRRRSQKSNAFFLYFVVDA
eukprot:144855-Rhodomonas_salina.2